MTVSAHTAPFTLTGRDLEDGRQLPAAHMSGAMGVPGGLDQSPELSWQGAPVRTRSYALTLHDPDASTGSGFWHWAVMNIPVAVNTLPAGTGGPSSSLLPPGAVQLPNDAGFPHYVGAAPPPGGGPHRYVFALHALDVPKLPIPHNATPAMLRLAMREHIVGLAMITLIAWPTPTKQALGGPPGR